MTYQPIGSGKVRDWLWAGVVVLSMAVGLLWFFWFLDPFEGQSPAQPAAQAAPSAELITAPEGEQIVVDLPTTPVSTVAETEPATPSGDTESR